MIQPLLADLDLGDVIKVLVMIAVVGFTVLTKLLSNKDARPGNVTQRPHRPPQPQQLRPGQAKRPVAPNVEAEIERFLREARGEKPTAPPQPVQATAAATQKRVIEAIPIKPVIVPGRDFGSSLAEHVAETMGKDSISTRDAHLGDLVETTGEHVEEHLDNVFHHKVGQLADNENVKTGAYEGTAVKLGEQESAATTTAEEILAMLQTPQSIRNVFIISEILRPPDI